jgi:hypothetical protein
VSTTAITTIDAKDFDYVSGSTQIRQKEEQKGYKENAQLRKWPWHPLSSLAHIPLLLILLTFSFLCPPPFLAHPGLSLNRTVVHLLVLSDNPKQLLSIKSPRFPFFVMIPALFPGGKKTIFFILTELRFSTLAKHICI